MSPAKLISAQKIISVVDKLMPGLKEKSSDNTRSPTKYFRPGEKILFNMFKRGREFKEDCIITKRVGRVMYIVCSTKDI